MGDSVCACICLFANQPLWTGNMMQISCDLCYVNNRLEQGLISRNILFGVLRRVAAD